MANSSTTFCFPNVHVIDILFREWSTPCLPELLTSLMEEMDTISSTFSPRFSRELHARMMISFSCQVCCETIVLGV